MTRSAVVAGLCLATAIGFTGCSTTDGAPETSIVTTTAVEVTTASTAAVEVTTATGPTVSFTTQDGVALEGFVFGSGPDWVVLGHMRPATMESWFPFAEVLAASGYTAFPFNFRGYGASAGSGFSVDVDTAAAVDFAFASGAETVSLIGASMGGTAAIAVAAQSDIGAVITLSAPAAFSGVDAVTAMASVESPTLLIVAADDQPFASDVAALAAAARGQVNTLFLDGRSHGTALFADHGAALNDQILAHLSSSLE